MGLPVCATTLDQLYNLYGFPSVRAFLNTEEILLFGYFWIYRTLWNESPARMDLATYQTTNRATRQ